METQTKTTTPKPSKAGAKKVAAKKVAAAEETIATEPVQEQAAIDTTENDNQESNDENEQIDMFMQKCKDFIKLSSEIEEMTKTTSIPSSAKDFTALVTKLPKVYASMQSAVLGMYSQTVLSQTKELNKKQKNKKSSENKDTSNSHLYKAIPCEDFMRNFIVETDKYSDKEAPSRDEISRIDAQRAVYAWIDKHYPRDKDGKRPTIEITGELKTLFSHFEKVMNTRLKFMNEEIKKMEKAKQTLPKKLLDSRDKVQKHIDQKKASNTFVHTNVMEYNSYGFPKEKLW